MTEIKRTGPPTPQNVKGRVFTWTMPLNTHPPRPWIELFTKTKDRSIDCTPEGVRFYQATAIFESDERQVPTWVKFIDGWVAAANERYAKVLADEDLRQAALADQQRDPTERLREAAEKFKNL